MTLISNDAYGRSTVEAMTNPSTIAITNPNFSALQAADPLLTPVGALAIND
jgi:hypothetical protein